MTTNNMQAGPNINGEIWPGWRNPENFIVVSDAYPTVTALAADLILPSAMWVEKEGAYGNAERRTQFWRQQVKAPGESRSDLWQLMEFSKRFKVEEVWPAELLAKKPEYKGKTLYDVLYANGAGQQVSRSTEHRRRATTTTSRSTSATTCRRACSRNTRNSAAATRHDLAPFDTYHQARGLRWPVVDGKETLWRFREGYDPYVKKGEGVQVLRQARRQGA